jgi:type II secretory pathway pseudopilin PulG
MNTRQLSSRTVRSSSAFSLIEVVLALSIVAVGLVSIMGLFPQGLNSAKNAADDSLCAIVAQDTIADRRIDIQIGASSIGAANIPPRWFTANGQEIIGPTSATNAMFKCMITALPFPGLPNLEQTQVQIFWPWYNANLNTKTPAPANTNIFVTQITKY